MNPARPNTNLSNGLIQADVILVCGEDEAELLSALKAVRPEIVPQSIHRYRCYHFWDCQTFTLIWTGIGTGCLEPLLYEILDIPTLQRILLMGTAGATDYGKLTLMKGRAYAMAAASPFAAGVTPVSNEPLAPVWNQPLPADVQTATIVSTDYYYGYSPKTDARTLKLIANDVNLARGRAETLPQVQLVDMETAQFYHFCRLLGLPGLQYIAIKGPANIVGDFGEQNLHSGAVLEASLQIATRLLQSGQTD